MKLRFPWTKTVLAEQQAAEAERRVTERMRNETSAAEIQAERVIRHADLNGFSRIAKELFAS